MEPAHIAIITGMGAIAYLIRVIPQLFFAGRGFPESFDRYLRYLSYALIVSIISVTLFFTKSRLDWNLAPGRAVALAAAVVLAYGTGKPLIGLFAGTLVALAFSWLG